LGTDSEQGAKGGNASRLARATALIAIGVGIVLVAFVLFGSSGGHTYHLLFENGGQLVKGNQVLVAGQPVGTIDSITLTDNAQADVTVTTDDPLREGTTAIIRETSLSGEANRYVSLTPGPNNNPDIPNGGDITGDATQSPIDLDQLFNTLNGHTRRALQRVFAGQATIYAGNTQAANRTYKYFAPGLDSSQRLFQELSRDQANLTSFIVSSSKVLTAVAARHNDLTNAIGHANTALGAIATQNTALDRSLRALPPTLRQSNTTFVNLRAALDDLTPLVDASKPATKNLPKFLARLRPVAQNSIPIVNNLAATLTTPGPSNDLTDVLNTLPGVERKAAKASPAAVAALNASQPNIAFARPYAPDLVAFITKLAQGTGYYDGNGHYARVSAADTGVFAYNSGTSTLEPNPPPTQYQGLQIDTTQSRCPGAATQPIAGSNPFLDDGNLLGMCDPANVPPGP
jgi:phospholipid/cholesterol/gamma-HCH transport system substrate-binding protein